MAEAYTEAMPQTLDDTVRSAAPSGKERLFWQLHLGGWLCFAGVQFVLGFTFREFVPNLLNRLTLLGCGLLLGLVLRAFYRRVKLREMSMPAAVAVMFAASVGAGALMNLPVIWEENAYARFSGAAPMLRDTMTLVNMVFTWGFTFLGWSLLYVAVNYRLEVQDVRERAIRAEALAQAARLQALRAQLEPHFLFNTLNSIATLVMEQDSKAALATLDSLSRFLRMTLDQAGAAEIRVAEELEFARRYAEIQQTRFGDRLRVDFEVEPAVRDALVPALILQPLVENAVKHGVLSQERPGHVSVSIRADAGRLAICVRDDGPGFGAAPVRHGVGLANTAARLDALYGAAARLSLGAGAGQGSAVVIELPLRSQAA